MRRNPLSPIVEVRVHTFAICENKGKPFVRETKLTRAFNRVYGLTGCQQSFNIINRRGNAMDYEIHKNFLRATAFIKSRTHA